MTGLLFFLFLSALFFEIYLLFSAGGVELAIPDGRIKCVNTLESRLELLQQDMLPEIRTLLFGKNENRAFYN